RHCTPPSFTLTPSLQDALPICNTGPTATAPADCCTALYVLLPVLRSGKINTVACPATSDSGILEAATDGETAASYCSGPSTFSSDRKSTRLNSSHVSISYAVFC